MGFNSSGCIQAFETLLQRGGALHEREEEYKRESFHDNFAGGENQFLHSLACDWHVITRRINQLISETVVSSVLCFRRDVLTALFHVLKAKSIYSQSPQQSRFLLDF